MIATFQSLHPVVQALIATLFTWFCTALGAAPVFLFKTFDKKHFNFFLGFAGGVMVAASFWSLLAPAIEMAGGSVVAPAIGFLGGGFFLWAVDRFIPHLHPFAEVPDGPKGSQLKRSTLLVMAITLHNFPEGLAVGVALGAAASGVAGATVAGGLALALGIGLQNLPEGLAVSMPLRKEGLSRSRAFMYGQASGAVEPIAGMLGAAAVVFMSPLLPYALSFAAGAMIFVVVEELIPESQDCGDTDFPTLGFMVGFAIMMILDVALS
ncbi:ZIP family metal transporter [Candidatus Sumerlaeota bacterium]|nr:ZIP family metal transporter [Candidatus Sumerlaeales bacterium]NLD61526.1 ZIP family metal transporter [Candidatus Sumerlaeota bacterium]